MFGSEQARLAAGDWLDESELMDSPPRSTSRDWRAVTVAASARLADRLNVGVKGRTPLLASAGEQSPAGNSIERSSWL
jgi:hypothetical protein